MSTKKVATKEPKVAEKKTAAKKVEKEVAEVKKTSKAASKGEAKKPVVKAALRKSVAHVAEPKAEKSRVKTPKEEPLVIKPADEVKVKTGDFDYAILLQGVKKLSKAIMFVKVDEAEDRSNKKKMSSEVKSLDMKPTSAIRHKSSLAEETTEELTERILKELEEQNRLFEREVATQMCTRCNRNLVSPEFWVDKHLGYCEECAMILKLGQSKEARKVEYQMDNLGDSLDEEDDDIIGPNADDLKDADDDFGVLDD